MSLWCEYGSEPSVKPGMSQVPGRAKTDTGHACEPDSLGTVRAGPGSAAEFAAVGAVPTEADLYAAIGSGLPLYKVARIAASLPSEYPNGKDV
jgi:hypothetical protein